MRAYPAAFTPDPDGGFTITFRDVPEAITEGDTREEVLRAEDALESALAMYVAAKEPLPTSSEAEADEVIVPPFGVGDGESRVVRGNARTRRWSCRARASATLAPPANQSRARPASRLADGTSRNGARRTRPAADRRRGTSGMKQAASQRIDD
jgi:predicted RNase H-like HicB family nuclease